jgi:DNA-binding NarL/FixJ family response regulator
MTVRVLLADDQPAIRAGFRLLIDSTEDLRVVAEAADGDEAVSMARAAHPDVVVMDVRMPGADGLSATRSITADPDLTGTRVLVLTTFELDEYVLEALRCGASGFLGKDADADEVFAAIRTVAAGRSLLSPRATATLVTHFLARPEADLVVRPASLSGLTPRERQVVTLVGLGLSNQEIAEELVVSPLTAKTHVNRAMGKLGVRDRAQLVVTAYRAGLVRPPEQPG